MRDPGSWVRQDALGAALFSLVISQREGSGFMEYVVVRIYIYNNNVVVQSG
jgi:hypothetical protein